MPYYPISTTTVHVIGRCPVKGCRNRRRNTYPGKIVGDRWRQWTEWKIPAAEPYGAVFAHLSKSNNRNPGRGRPSRYAAYHATGGGHAYDRAWFAAVQAAGWICPDHDTFMDVTEITGVYRADKTCDGRCRNAIGPNCECSCGGEQHGANFAPHPASLI